MAILITGGTGFVGGNLIDELLENKEEWGVEKDDIYVFARKKSDVSKLQKKGIAIRYGDLAKPETFPAALENISKVFHLGAVVLDQSPPELLHKVNVLGTTKLFEAFQKQPSAEKFIFVSTWGVFGYKVKPKPMDEEQSFDPTTEYHKSKVEAEKSLWQAYAKDSVPLAVARLPMILGPGDTLTTPRVIQAFFDDKVKLIGKGNNKFSCVHVRDAARALLSLGLSREANGEAFNVKSFDLSQKDYWKIQMDYIDYDKKIPKFPKWLALFYAWTKEVSAKIKGKGKATLTRHRVMRYGNTRVLDISKIQNKLDWKPKYTNGKEVLENTIKWLEENDFIDYQNKEVKILRRWEDHFSKSKK
jgi:nucleoside-diphosphate-sugar epimerase